MSERLSDLSTHWPDAFLEAIQAERGAAENTVQAYARDLADFNAWLDGEGAQTLSLIHI